MFLDLTERFPRGPKANLRSHHYEQSHNGNYYNRHETQLSAAELMKDKKTRGVIEDCSVKDHGFCAVTYGYDPLELKAFFKKFDCRDHWDVKRRINDLDPENEVQELSFLRGWNKQATRTRRGKRMGLRIGQLRRWVEANVQTAYYKFQTKYGRIHVHADSEQQAQSQYDLFLKPAIAEMESAGQRSRYQSDGAYYPRYVEPAIEGPAALAGLNDDFMKGSRRAIIDAKEQIRLAEERVTALENGIELVQSYAINMTTSYNYEETN
jgi:hypothetical protein